MEAKEALLIGPSNGWLFAQKIYSLYRHSEFLAEVGANAVELVMWLDDQERQISLLSGKIDAGFISLHLDDYCSEKSMHDQVLLAKTIFDKHNAAAAVIHPVTNPETYYEAFINAGIPAAIENMDANKSSGHSRWELWYLIEKFKLKFVLDVQHAYEHDDQMSYAWDLFHMAGANLLYLHVSGQNGKIPHSLVHHAENKGSIIKFLGQLFAVKNLPIILEGNYNTAQEVKTEIEFLKQELGF